MTRAPSVGKARAWIPTLFTTLASSLLSCSTPSIPPHSSLALPPQAKRSVAGLDVATYADTVRRERTFVSMKRAGKVVEIQTSSFPIRIEVLKEDLIKIRYSGAEQFTDEYTWSVDPAVKWPGADFDVQELADRIVIRTPKIQVVVTRSPVRVSLLNAQGKALLENQGLTIDPAEDTVNRAPGGPAQKRLIIGARFKMNPTEHFYGLGEKLRGPFDQSIDWRGRKRDPGADVSSMGNHFEGADGGANGNLMVPFLYSTQGYGFFFDTAYKTYWEFDSASQDSWYVKQDCDQDWETGQPRCQRAELRFYVMAPDTTREIFTRYTEITGKPVLPPRWLLGYLQSTYGYRNWAEVHQAAESLRGKGFPLDAIFLDLQWFGGVPGVHDQNGATRPEFTDCRHRRVGSFNWGKNDEFDFSNFRPNLAQLADQGVHIVPIEEGYFDTCNTKDASDNNNFEEARSKGFLAKKEFKSNEPALFANGDDASDGNFNTSGYFGQVGMIDTSSAEARDWFWSKHLPILKDGAATFWTDLGEPERFRWWWKYSGGLWHQDIHNVWDLNRARALYEGSIRDLPNRRPFIMSRSGYAGSQRYGVGIWSADAPARLKWAAAEPSAHLNLSVSGIPYTTSDIGGFGGYPVSSGEQFARWLQFESFSSLTRAHGNTSIGANVERITNPALFSDEISNVNRKYILWRESLIPYLYTHAREAYDSGMPILRALPLVWPGDSNVQDLGSEYLFGPSILVAPVLTGQDNHPDVSRAIYLPPGQWFDMHDGQAYSGGQWLKAFSAPLEKMPLFAQAGAIIPKGPALPGLSDPSWPLTRTLEIYPGVMPSRYSLYDDEGDGNAYRTGAFARTEITVQPAKNSVTVTVSAMKGNFAGKPASRAYLLELHAESQPVQVLCDGKPVTSTWDQKTRKLLVASPAVATGLSRKWIVQF